MVEKIVFLNALVPPKPRGLMVVEEIPFDTVKEIVSGAKEIVSFIGHPATAELLSKNLGVEIPVNRGMFVPERGDVAIVVRLKRRLPMSGGDVDVDVSDLEFLYVEYQVG